jgi:hypothetical protein
MLQFWGLRHSFLGCRALTRSSLSFVALFFSRGDFLAHAQRDSGLGRVGARGERLNVRLKRCAMNAVCLLRAFLRLDLLPEFLRQHVLLGFLLAERDSLPRSLFFLFMLASFLLLQPFLLASSSLYFDPALLGSPPGPNLFVEQRVGDLQVCAGVRTLDVPNGVRLASRDSCSRFRNEPPALILCRASGLQLFRKVVGLEKGGSTTR